MIYLVLYLLMGLTMFSFARWSRSKLMFMFAVWTVWPMMLALFIQRLLIENKNYRLDRICGYCGERMRKSDILQHILVDCKLNPLLMKINKAQYVLQLNHENYEDMKMNIEIALEKLSEQIDLEQYSGGAIQARYESEQEE